MGLKLLFSDLHLRNESASTVLGEVLPGIRDEALRHGVESIGFLGDWWQIRHLVPVELQNETRMWLHGVTERGIRVDLLPGNHDQVDDEGSNALEVFHDIPGVRVFTEPTWTSEGLWLPYRQGLEARRAALSMPRLGTPAVLFMHGGVAGAWMNDGRQDTTGTPPEDLRAFRWIFLGHYHRRQQLGKNAWFLGSPWQTRADEAGQPKGFALWDGQRPPVFVDRTWGRRFWKLDLRAVPEGVDLGTAAFDAAKALPIGPLDHVRVNLGEHGDRATVAAALAGASATLRVEQDEPEASTRARLGVAAAASVVEVVEELVHQQHGELDEGRLLAVVREVRGVAS